LLDTTVETDFAPIYAALAETPDIPIAGIEPDDKIFTRGTQRHATR
jgi:phenylalanine-4-hydroxylase